MHDPPSPPLSDPFQPSFPPPSRPTSLFDQLLYCFLRNHVEWDFKSQFTVGCLRGQTLNRWGSSYSTHPQVATRHACLTHGHRRLLTSVSWVAGLYTYKWTASEPKEGLCHEASSSSTQQPQSCPTNPGNHPIATHHESSIPRERPGIEDQALFVRTAGPRGTGKGGRKRHVSNKQRGYVEAKHPITPTTEARGHRTYMWYCSQSSASTT